MSNLSTDYNELNDDELIALFRKGDRQAAEFLLEKYKYIVKVRASSFFLLGGEKDDLLQEGMIGLFHAISEYDSGRDACLSTFCNLVVARHLYNAVRNMGRQKHLPLNNFISLNDKEAASGEGEDIATLQSFDGNPEKLIIEEENIERIEKIIEEELSSFEREVLELRLMGMKNREIAKILGRDEKSTDNALTRLRSKLGKKIRMF